MIYCDRVLATRTN